MVILMTEFEAMGKIFSSKNPTRAETDDHYRHPRSKTQKLLGRTSEVTLVPRWPARGARRVTRRWARENHTDGGS